MKHDFEDITADDLESEQMQLIADECGIEVARSLMRHLPGLELYIPTSALTAMNLAYVRSHYTGFNAATIAGRLGLNREDVIALSKVKGDLPPILKNAHLKLIAGLCGEDVVYALVKVFGGQKLYIPSNGFKHIIKQRLNLEFNGANTQELALKYGVTERYVRSVIAKKYAENSQLSFIPELLEKK